MKKIYISRKIPESGTNLLRDMPASGEELLEALQNRNGRGEFYCDAFRKSG
jgi:hypothetical protein